MFKEPGAIASGSFTVFRVSVLMRSFSPVLRRRFRLGVSCFLRRFRGLVLPHSAVRPGAHPSAAGSMRKENSRSSAALTL